METSDEPAPDDPMLEGMEGLIAVMRHRRPSPRDEGIGNDSTLLPDDGDDPGSAASWDAEGPAATELEPGTRVGRYIVLHRLGAGGMGVVHAAYDPELDRKVALKVLLPSAVGESGRTRLLREAQALAKLSHPNVVAIHDVGTVGEQVWLAMELVHGRTLRAWLDAPRRWQEVLAIVLEAGRGLAAAHAVRLLHRDFKPDNVMVGDDGRVRVMDFGLARGRSRTTVEHDPAPGPSLDALGLEVTRAGSIVGTPGYMAAEQYDSVELTAAADQFAFCVTLWEALHGEKPFGGGTWMEIALQVHGGRLRPPPKGRAVPGWLRRACERGLAADPQQRWPSMLALLDVLAQGRRRARMRTGLVAVGVLAALGAGVEGWRRLDVARRTAACEATGDEIASAWSPEREQALRDAMLGTGATYAAATADATVPWLATQAEEWRQARVEACLDASVRGTSPPELDDRAQWCLDERRAELQSLVDELTLADAEVLQKAVVAVSSLTSPAGCLDPRTLEALVLPPEEHREAIRAVHDDVTRAANAQRAGRYAKGLDAARDALARAEAIAWPPLTATARLQVGMLLEKSGAYAESETALEAAYFEATEGEVPRVVFDAASQLAAVVGYRAARHAEGYRWGRLAEVALARLHDGEGLKRASLLRNLALVHHGAGALDESKRAYEQALAIREAALGSEHPSVASLLSVLGIASYSAGDYARAEALHERAVAIYERTLSPEHPDVATSLGHLADVQWAKGEHERANAIYAKTLAVYEEVLGPDHPKVAEAAGNLAAYQVMIGAHPRAIALYERSLAIRERTLRPGHPHIAAELNNLANALSSAGERSRAKELWERALAIDEASLGPDHPSVGFPLAGLADVALAQQRPGDAVRLAQRTVSLWEAQPGHATDLAHVRFTLARASWEAPEGDGRDRARARALAEQAREAYRAAGKAGADELAAVERWLAEHPGAP